MPIQTATLLVTVQALATETAPALATLLAVSYHHSKCAGRC